MKSGEQAGLPAIDPAKVEPLVGSDYPAPFDRIAAGRERRALGDALGLKNFGVNLTRLPPGCASSQRHWHTRQDEFVYVLEGEVVLVTDAGETTIAAKLTQAGTYAVVIPGSLTKGLAAGAYTVVAIASPANGLPSATGATLLLQ